MAAYLDLRDVMNDSDLQAKTETALWIAVQSTLDAPVPTLEQQKYAAHVFSNFRTEARKALASIIAKNKDADITQILAATDSGVNSIQENVDLVITSLSAAYNAANP